jgi:hypothetical protein
VASDRVAEALAAGDRCRADQLADQLVADAQAAAVPAAYRARLLSAARSLAATIECPPPPPPPPPVEEDDDGGNGKGKGKGNSGKKDDD